MVKLHCSNLKNINFLYTCPIFCFFIINLTALFPQSISNCNLILDIIYMCKGEKGGEEESDTQRGNCVALGLKLQGVYQKPGTFTILNLP